MAERKVPKPNKDEAEVSVEGRPVAEAGLLDLEADRVEAYLNILEEQASDRPDNIPGSPDEKLVALGLGRVEGGEMRPTAVALLLFGKNPQKFLPNSSVKLARFKGRDVTGLILDRAELYGTLDKIIEDTARFVGRNMKVGGPIKGLYREDITEYPIVAVREAIANAVAHRDYGISGQKIALRIFDDRLEVESPGGLAGPVTLENLGQKRFSRNPLLTRVMYELRLVEEMGTGIKRMRRTMAELGSAPPTFMADADSFTAILPARMMEEEKLPQPESQPETNPPAFEISAELRPEYFALMRSGLNERQARGLLYARERGRLTNKDYRAINSDITDETARLDLLNLVDKGYLVKFGDKRGAAYLPR